jgi:3-phosphoshikimate 1-carboxyvinyltransferase
MSGAPRRKYTVTPSARLAGTLTVPGDKSISHRALMLGSIADGPTTIEGFLDSEDCLATMRAMQALGVRIERPADRTVHVHGVGLHGLRAASAPLDMGNSGTAMRLMTGLLAGQAFDTVLVGDASLMRRPMERAAVPLRAMGAAIDTESGRPPVRIHGGRRLAGFEYALPVASAQVKSAVLLAGLYADGATTVVEPAVTRDHTERMLIGFGADVEADRGTIRLQPPGSLAGTSLTVPGDFSSAAFFVVAATLGAESQVTIRNVGINPTRTGLLDMLGLMGARIRVVNHRNAGAEPVADLVVSPAELRGIEVPPALVPLAIDEFPAFFVAAACADGETLVSGAEELRVKESDRIAAMAAGLAVLGVETEVRPDGLRLRGIGAGARLGGGRIDSCGDHRIAMAFAMASVRARAQIEIDDVANVATSFPGFVATAQAVGIGVTEGQEERL